MATQQATPSFSMSPALLRRLRLMLPRHGDRSKLVACLLEMWMNNEIDVSNRVILKSRVALRNTSQTGGLDARRVWQHP